MKRTRWIVGLGGAYELLELGYLNANSLSKVILEGINCKDTMFKELGYSELRLCSWAA